MPLEHRIDKLGIRTPNGTILRFKGPFKIDWTATAKADQHPIFKEMMRKVFEFLNGLNIFKFTYTKEPPGGSATRRTLVVDYDSACEAYYPRPFKKGAFGSTDDFVGSHIQCDESYGAGSGVHEVLHTLGILHTHQNPDSIVQILTTQTKNYGIKSAESFFMHYPQPFSIMHYSLGLSTMKLRDPLSIKAILDTMGLTEKNKALFEALLPEIGQQYMLSRTDILNLFYGAYRISDSVLSVEALPILGLVPGESYNPRIILKFIELYSDPVYYPSIELLSEANVTVAPNDCSMVNLRHTHGLPLFLGKITCSIENLPSGIFQTDDPCILSLENMNRSMTHTLKTTFSNGNTYANCTLTLLPSSSFQGNNTCLRPLSPTLPLMTVEAPLTALPHSFSWKVLFNTIGDHLISSTNLIAILSGFFKGIYLTTLTEFIHKKYPLNHRVLNSLIYLPHILIAIVASYNLINQENDLKRLLPLIDQYGYIYDKPPENSALIEVLASLYPFIAGTLCNIGLTLLVSKSLPGDERVLKLSLVNALNISLSALFVNGSVIKPLITGLAYLGGDAAGVFLPYSVGALIEKVILTLRRQPLENDPQREANQETSDTNTDSRDEEQAACSTLASSAEYSSNRSLSVVGALQIASRTVSPHKFFRASVNFFCCTKTSEERKRANTSDAEVGATLAATHITAAIARKLK